MPITWFDARNRTGQASLTENYITLNALASVPFAYANKVQVGMDGAGNLVISPISKDRVERGDLDEYTLNDIVVAKSYARICSRELMRHIAEETGLKLGDNAQSFETAWNERENLLTIRIKKGGR